MCDLNLFDGAAEVWVEHRVKSARKPHVCDCCHGAINPGDGYKSIFMVHEGEASTEKECVLCGVMMQLFKGMHRQWFSPSGMADLLRECMADGEMYDEDRDEYVPAGPGAWWAVALGEMKRRRALRAAALKEAGT